MNKTDLTGKTDEHIEFLSHGAGIHRDMVAAYTELQTAAQKAGFGLHIASGFRNFDRQLKIWNGKYLGLIPIFDDAGITLDIDKLEPFERIKHILRFSALPGASRHHWGTDFDYVDKLALPEGYQVQLTEDEYNTRGLFGPLRDWLAQNADKYEFHFPYLYHNGGIAQEPWHLSYTPIANNYLELLESEPKILFDLILKEDIEGKKHILQNFEHILDYYILNVNRGE